MGKLLDNIAIAGSSTRMGTKHVIRFTVEVWQRQYPVDASINPEGVVTEYQADIFTTYAGDHHGLGETPGVALSRAAMHLAAYEGAPK